MVVSDSFSGVCVCVYVPILTRLWCKLLKLNRPWEAERASKGGCMPVCEGAMVSMFRHAGSGMNLDSLTLSVWIIS